MTKALAGCSNTSCGVPTCSIRPWFITTTLVGHLEGLFLVVRDEDAGHVDLVVQPAQPLPQLLPHLGVEGAERLVEQQHLRLGRQRPRQGHALPLAAGELRRIAACSSPSSRIRCSSSRDALAHLGVRPACARAGRRRRSRTRVMCRNRA